MFIYLQTFSKNVANKILAISTLGDEPGERLGFNSPLRCGVLTLTKAAATAIEFEFEFLYKWAIEFGFEFELRNGVATAIEFSTGCEFAIEFEFELRNGVTTAIEFSIGCEFEFSSSSSSGMG